MSFNTNTQFKSHHSQSKSPIEQNRTEPNPNFESEAEEMKKKIKSREEDLMSEDEKKALRGSKFAPLPSLSSSSSSSSSRPQPRLAHPGGPLTTNKAAALAKFLERKLQDPNGLASINPDLIELAVKNAKETLLKSGTSSSGRNIKHVDSFGDSEDSCEEEKLESSEPKKRKKETKKKKKKKSKKQNAMEDQGCAIMKKPKKKKFKF